MKKTIKIKLITNEEQHNSLLATMNMFSVVCNDISSIAFENKEFRKFLIHKLAYHNLKEKYTNFSSQLLIRAFDIVAQSYIDRGCKRKYPTYFKKQAAVVYDDRIITFKENFVNIWTVNGRTKIPIHIHNKEIFNLRKGQSDLIFQNGNFYLCCVIDFPNKEKFIPKDVIGIDLGINQLATTSDHQSYSGDLVEKKRIKYSSHRYRLQKKNSRNAKRKIKQIGNKEARFRKDVNHCISKKIVEKAKGTNCAISLENLTGINNRTTVRKSQRNQRMSWSFYQLKTFIKYKAEEQGITVIEIDPKNTSRTCNKCKYCDKKNRKNQSGFHCLECGYTENADYNASLNIRELGLQSISLLLPE
jgi:IS605 OrfB family transposase